MKIKDLVDNIVDKDFVSAENQFQSIMNDKVADALANEKERMAQNLFKDDQEQEA